MRRGNAFGRPAVSAINGAKRARCQRASRSAGFCSRAPEIIRWTPLDSRCGELRSPLSDEGLLIDILLCLKVEDSYGVRLVLRDGFGGFLG
jgi:hypothetical protein